MLNIPIEKRGIEMADTTIKDKYLIKGEPFLYTKEFEWVLQEGDIYIYGISNYAAVELGELAYVELPEVGDTFEEGKSMGIIEALKTVVDFYAPFDCEIIEVHEELEDDASVITEDCYNEGWIVKVKPTGPTDVLITPENFVKQVEKEIEEGSH
ncbi:MAG: glycine cleavage system protein H [Candidatus Heimdallarchaeota archaeon]|nr:glycine cleavage system protein H [Candidatus Heimdallarchaeota archaeon]